VGDAVAPVGHGEEDRVTGSRAPRDMPDGITSLASAPCQARPRTVEGAACRHAGNDGRLVDAGPRVNATRAA
jgi:hypothetical protein